MRCRNGRECEKGLLCRSSKRCVKAVEGQRCLSDCWCPEGYRCSKKTRKCTDGLVGAADRFPSVLRAWKSAVTTDCYLQDACINGICFPHRHGRACEKFRLGMDRGLACRGGVAVEATEGVQCANMDQCVTGSTCRDFRMCSPSKPGDRCRGDFNCPQSARCHNWRCVLPPLRRGEFCGKRSQCRNGHLCKLFGHTHGLFSTGAICSNP